MKSSRVLVVVLLLVLSRLACQLGGLTSGVDLPDSPLALPGQPPISVNAPPNPLAAQDSFLALYARVSPGVVIIKVTGPDGEALGAGFVYDSAGHVVTNYHVVQDAVNDKVEVDFLSGYKAYGTVIGTDLDSDLAVVKTDAPASELHLLALGDSDALSIGQTVIAIGNPFQYFGSMSVGIVSALHRTLDSQHLTVDTGQPFTAGDLIQIDTAINPGNSGGPLFDMNGAVIGVNRAIETTNFSSSGQPLNSGGGPTRVVVQIPEGGNAQDTDGDGLDQVAKVLAGRGYADGGRIDLLRVPLVLPGKPGGGRSLEFMVPLIESQLLPLRPEVIVTFGSITTKGVHLVTRSIPIVANVSDPVAIGVASSLARPGGNVMGVAAGAAETALKATELLKTVVPRIARLAIFHDQRPVATGFAGHYERAARSLGIEPVMVASFEGDGLALRCSAVRSAQDPCSCKARV